MKAIIKFLFSLVASISLLIFLQFSVGDIPPLGKMLNPFSGIWVNALGVSTKEKDFEILGLKQSVKVLRDENNIPHIQASHLDDLYFTQGFIVASDRLFQMDLNTRIAAGRLSELAGQKSIKMDEFFVRIGFRKAAQLALEEMMKDEQTRQAIEAYSRGVNAYIKTLNEKTYPVEYKILGSRPEAWTPLRTAYLLKLMAFGLSGRSYDLPLTKLLNQLGPEKVEDLFPDFPMNLHPVVGNTLNNPSLTLKSQVKAFKSQFDDFAPYLMPFVGNGSNNWAVTSKKSLTGSPIIANDVHLQYTLPSVWYEMHLQAPGIDVYGVTFPATPGIILGFNNKIAWAVTNGTTDVMDWYEVDFKDDSHDEYSVNDSWKPSTRYAEQIRVKNSEAVIVDMVETDLGPIQQFKMHRGLALRWKALEPSNELKVFLNLNKAQSFSECMQSLKYMNNPGQNFICADKVDVGLKHAAGIPLRRPGQGRFIESAADPLTAWGENIPFSELPESINPQSGFLRSANQNVVDSKYPHYMGWRYDDDFRASRIETLLKNIPRVDSKYLMEMQNDIYDELAQAVLPNFLNLIDEKTLAPIEIQALTELKNWDYKSQPHSVSPSLFYFWWKHFQLQLFKDVLPDIPLHVQTLIPEDEPDIFLPPRKRTLELLLNQNSKLSQRPKSAQKKWDQFWIDDLATEKKEDLKDIVRSSFTDMWKELSKTYGEDFTKWQWARLHPTTINHIARMPGLGSRPLEVGGYGTTINANKGFHGPVWRMVVELGDEPKAFGNFPGGVTGNPMHPEYTQFVDSWAKGKLRKLNFNVDKPDKTWRIQNLMPAKEEQ